jgi:hypothetical protein
MNVVLKFGPVLVHVFTFLAHFTCIISTPDLTLNSKSIWLSHKILKYSNPLKQSSSHYNFPSALTKIEVVKV